MRRELLIFLFLPSLLNGAAYAQKDMPAYRLFDSNGKSVDFKKVVDRAAEVDVVFFGEQHNDPIAHWLQLELTRALDQRGGVVVGMEMFEFDDQIIVDEYLNNKMNESSFTKEAKVWPNYSTDYRPVIEYAKEKSVPVIATNIPRRYASLVSKEGQVGLLELEGVKSFVPALPFDVTKEDRGYAEMEEMMQGHGHGMDMSLFVEAQAIKDYTMASNIFGNLPEDGVFLHLNGTFHSQYRAGIVPYLLKEKPELKIVVIASVPAETMEFSEEWAELGDYILVTPERMTKTH